MAHDEGLAPLVLGQQGLRRLQVPCWCLHIPLLACLIVGVDEMMYLPQRFPTPSFTASTRATSPLVLPEQPKGAAQVPQDGTGLVQGKASVLELGKLPIQTGGLE